MNFRSENHISMVVLLSDTLCKILKLFITYLGFITEPVHIFSSIYIYFQYNFFAGL
jgi:hypothetical protein